MILRCVVVTLMVVIGLVAGPSTHAVLAQNLRDVGSAIQEFSSADTEGFRVVTTRNERAGRTLERSVIEGPSINGDSTVLSEVEDSQIQIGAETTRRTRREFVTDVNGHPSLVSTLEEQRSVRSDGGERTVRDFTEPDVNGRARSTRREQEETVTNGDGLFRTRIDVSEPSTRGNDLVATERVEQKERRDGDQVLELDRTTYTNRTGSGPWVAQERRVVTREYSEDEIRSVEAVYRANDAGNLVESDRIVSREWTGPGGQEHRTEEVFSRDVPDEPRAVTPRLSQRVEMVRTSRSPGSSSTTRTVREPRNDRMQVVEQVVERTRPDGLGGTVIERETQQLDVNGRLQTVSVRRARQSVM